MGELTVEQREELRQWQLECFGRELSDEEMEGVIAWVYDVCQQLSVWFTDITERVLIVFSPVIEQIAKLYLKMQ